MKKILLIFLSVFTTLSYAQCPDPPSVASEQYFCSEAAWLLIGEGADYLSDLQIFPDEVGWTLTWYEDNAGVPGPVIANPDSELLVAGAVYHVTQTDTANCESNPTMITLNEKDCGCIKDPTFEDQQGNESARGYEFQQWPSIANHKTCGQSMAGAPPYPLSPNTNGTGTNDEAVFTTPGPDPTPNIQVTRTNPDNPQSAHGFRLNRPASGDDVITSMSKEFIAGEVFVFNFSLILENPAGHDYDEQPFAQVRLYDQNNNIIQQRCLVSDPNDCIFIPTGSGSNVTLYSEWSCMKLNTFAYQGQPLRAEFIVSWCELSAHYGYMYLDDLYAGDDGPDICGDSSFGYALIDQVKPAGGDCFIPEPSEPVAGCSTGVSASIPGFPLEVCGSYDAPISQGPPPVLDDISLNIVQNDIVVGTVKNPSQGSGPNTFCFTINETDINVLPYGDFDFELVVDFELNCGKAYNFYIDDKSSANVCPRAGCPIELSVCDIDNTGIGQFDLTVAEPDIYNNTWDANDMVLTYYEDEQDAHDNVNPIADPQNYTNSVPGGQIIYIRIDWTIPEVTGCYYLAKLPLAIYVLPDLSNLEDEYTMCSDNFVKTLSGVPQNLADLGDVTYKWFKDGVQLASSASFYDAKETGEYTVVVSNFGCESSHTFTISSGEFSIDLGDPVVICDGSPLTLTATLVPGPNTPPIDLNEAEFLWNTGETTQTITVTETGTYSVEVTYKECVETKSVQVSIGDLEVSLGEDLTLCDTSQGTELTATVTGVPENEVTYLWSTGETTQTIEVFGFGTYSVDVTWKECMASDSITVIQAQAPEITLGENFQKCQGDEVTLEVTFLENPTGNLSYSWFRDGGSISGEGPSIVISEFGTYKVVVDNEGCIAEASVTISRYDSNPNCTISQGISPEGSPGFNDYLDLEFLAIRTGIENLQIFNRDGRLVYEYKNYVNQWEGQTTDGDKLPTGVYYYVINLSGDDPVFGLQTSGWIYLNRGIN